MYTHGYTRCYVNRPFAELFQNEEELNEELLRGNSSPRAMILRTVHASDRAEVDRLLDYCFFISEEECCEAVHVLRVRDCGGGGLTGWLVGRPIGGGARSCVQASKHPALTTLTVLLPPLVAHTR